MIQLLHGNSFVTVQSSIVPPVSSMNNTNDSVGAIPSSSTFKGYKLPHVTTNANPNSNNSSKIKPADSERAKEIRENINKRIRDAKSSSSEPQPLMPQRKVFLNYYS
jgi:hypothetical protein